jgi:hypothetical protein
MEWVLKRGRQLVLKTLTKKIHLTRSGYLLVPSILSLCRASSRNQSKPVAKLMSAGLAEGRHRVHSASGRPQLAGGDKSPAAYRADRTADQRHAAYQHIHVSGGSQFVSGRSARGLELVAALPTPSTLQHLCLIKHFWSSRRGHRNRSISSTNKTIAKRRRDLVFGEHTWACISY